MVDISKYTKEFDAREKRAKKIHAILKLREEGAIHKNFEKINALLEPQAAFTALDLEMLHLLYSHTPHVAKKKIAKLKVLSSSEVGRLGGIAGGRGMNILSNGLPENEYIKNKLVEIYSRKHKVLGKNIAEELTTMCAKDKYVIKRSKGHIARLKAELIDEGRLPKK